MFKAQASRARAQSLSNKWRNDRTSASTAIASGNAASIKRVVSNKSFNDFANKAYAAKHGYSIRKNKRTGEVEMFVRGTTFKNGGVEWLQNALETPATSMVGLGPTIAGHVSRFVRRKHSKFLSDVAKKNRVTVIYGHSRGAAIVEDMKVPGAAKLGLDGATLLNRNSSITNYRQNQFFDGFIGVNARKTIKEDRWTPITRKRYHKVYAR